MLGGEPFVISTGVEVAPTRIREDLVIKFRPASAQLTPAARRGLRKLANKARSRAIDELRVDGRTFYIAADFARDLATARIEAITRQLRKLGITVKIEKRIVPTKDISDEQVRTYRVALKARPKLA